MENNNGKLYEEYRFLTALEDVTTFILKTLPKNDQSNIYLREFKIRDLLKIPTVAKYNDEAVYILDRVFMKYQLLKPPYIDIDDLRNKTSLIVRVEKDHITFAGQYASTRKSDLRINYAIFQKPDFYNLIPDDGKYKEVSKMANLFATKDKVNGYNLMQCIPFSKRKDYPVLTSKNYQKNSKLFNKLIATRITTLNSFCKKQNFIIKKKGNIWELINLNLV